MCMRISPINIQQKQISHKAVNQKLLNEAIKTYNRAKPYHNQGPLITSIINRVYYKLLSKQDAIDTLEAIKPYAEGSIERIKTLINDLKKAIANQ